MPISNKLKGFLDENEIRYVAIAHSRVYTAQEVAASVHVKGKMLAKTVIVKAGRRNVMVVLPASYQIDLPKLQSVLQVDDLRLATEDEFKNLFPECEAGAMPPFGNLYGMEVVVDRSLAEDDEIVFNAGNHVEVVRMPYADFARLVRPGVGAFATHR